MRRLILVRHAKASRDDPSLADFDRPLERRGRKDAPEAGRRLAARGFRPDAVVTSPAVRALETAQALAESMDLGRRRLHEDPRVYDAPLEALVEVVRGLDDVWQTVLLVGHDPGITRLADWLGGVGLSAMPTCGAAVLLLDADAWADAEAGRASLVFFDSPKAASG